MKKLKDILKYKTSNIPAEITNKAIEFSGNLELKFNKLTPSLYFFILYILFIYFIGLSGTLLLIKYI